MNLGKTADRIGELSLPDGYLGGVSFHTLASLRPDSEAMARVSVRCATCGPGCEGWVVDVPYFFAGLTSCGPCIAAKNKEAQLQRAKAYWEEICPKEYRDTDRNHPGFPTPQYNATANWLGEDSLFLFGPSGKGKTRLAMLLLKRCLVRGSKYVGILWPEILRSVKSNQRTLEFVERWGKYDVLLADDSLLTAAGDHRITESFKDILDLRMRHQRRTIITSQIGGDDVDEQLKKFGKETKADRELAAALVRRLRETCRVIPFAAPEAQPGQQNF